MIQKVETEIGGKKLSLETGWMAKQADGAVVARYGDTVVLSTAVSCKEIREGIDFLPLTVDYQEKAYAVGRIPGSFFRREGRPTERETLTCRLIDRPLRPLFPKGIELAHTEIQKLIDAQIELRRLVGREKIQVAVSAVDESIVAGIEKSALDKIIEALVIPNKTQRQATLDAILGDVLSQLNPEGTEGDKSRDIRTVFHKIEKREMRKMILKKGIRADGRGPADIRTITCDIGILPRTHGSALFTRGETQSLAVVTLGTADDEQFVEALEGESTKAFMLHYNFPPFSVGEARQLRGPGRREIGHGALAERAIKPIIQGKDVFPYTLRIVSVILESNGSSSMATVCGSSLALMDAGVPITAPVAGIAMGLIKEADDVEILSDILGVEDHLGDMDFKVTGTADGITAIQMDIKIAGITTEVMGRALEQARKGRLHILDKMIEAISVPRETLSAHAPRIFTIKVKPARVGEVIGPGGKMIRSIIERTGVKIDIDDSGLITIASTDEEAANKAIEIINKIVEEVEVGRIYLGTVRKIMDFGAFVEILPRTDGLVHISQLADFRVNNVADVVKEGDEILDNLIYY